jgi:hypothetical protein
MELALYSPFNILCDGSFFMGEKNQPCESRKGRSLEPMLANYCFFFHNKLIGFFFGTTNGININYLKKKKLIGYQFHHQNNTPNYHLLSYFLVIPIGYA